VHAGEVDVTRRAEHVRGDAEVDPTGFDVAARYSPRDRALPAEGVR
jgi:hypothetical protein